MNAYEVAKAEVAHEQFRSKVDRIKKMVGEFGAATGELKKAQEKVAGLEKAIESAKKDLQAAPEAVEEEPH